jgi:phage terminase small subunit
MSEIKLLQYINYRRAVNIKSRGDCMSKLTDKQEMFCKEYIIDLNATQAATRASYSAKTAGVIGLENLGKPLIQARLAELMKERSERVKIDAEYVLNRLRDIDQLDILDIMQDDLSAFKKLSEWPRVWRTSISGVDMKRIVDGDTEAVIEKIKWPDKVKNLDMIGRHVNIKAWDKEVQEVSISNNIMPVPTADSIDSWESAAQSQQDNILGKAGE